MKEWNICSGDIFRVSKYVPNKISQPYIETAAILIPKKKSLSHIKWNQNINVSSPYCSNYSGQEINGTLES